MPQLIIIVITIYAFINANGGFATFIDPAKPTREDKVNEAAFSCAGKLVLCFFNYYFNKRRAIDADTLDITITMHADRKYANDSDYEEMPKIYFRIILQEVANNVRMAKTEEERQGVYIKTKNWLAARTGLDLSQYDRQPIMVEITKPLPGTAVTSKRQDVANPVGGVQIEIKRAKS
jgi:hypothetical protein